MKIDKIIKDNPIRSVNEINTDVCTDPKCKWKSVTHAVSFHWLENPKDYYPNGTKK